VSEIRDAVAEYLRYLGEIGLEGLAPRSPAHRPARPRRAEPSPGEGAAPLPAGSLFEERPEIPEGLGAAKGLRHLREQVIGDCTRCKLQAGRTQVVFGVGDPQARLMFVGEGPGRDEDRQGEPFVGRAGQLLTKIIEAIGMRRSEVYIANVVKCRPPDNRNPEPDEVAACRPFLEAQIDLVRPEVIVLLGKVAAQVLLEVNTPIGRIRGRFLQVRGIDALATWHPAYLLRNPAAKRDAWTDMKKVRDRLARGS
jgi:DNA polymerase